MSGVPVANHVEMERKLEREHVQLLENVKEKPNKRPNALSRTHTRSLKNVPTGKMTAKEDDGKIGCKNGVHAHVTAEVEKK